MTTSGQIFQMDATDFLKMFADESIDLIVADPPYGIGYKAGCKTTNGGAKRKAAQSFGTDDLQVDWIQEAGRTLKSDGAIYVFTRWDVLHYTAEALSSAGLNVVQRIIWDKLHWGTGNLNYYGSQTEDVLFAVKPDHRLRWDKREGNIWRLTKLDIINHEQNYDNPTQKPERLLQRAILRSSDRGDLVVDPFCGTGSTLAAAARLGRLWIGNDISEYQVGIARKRLAHANEQFELWTDN